MAGNEDRAAFEIGPHDAFKTDIAHIHLPRSHGFRHLGVADDFHLEPEFLEDPSILAHRCRGHVVAVVVAELDDIVLIGFLVLCPRQGCQA